MNSAIRLAAAVGAFACLRVNAFLPTTKQHLFGVQTSTSSQLSMALTPVGPFCPFRSSAAMDLEPRVEEFHSSGPEFATEFASIQFDMQMGNAPDPERLRKVAEGMDQAVNQWEDLMMRLRLSKDFQTREYAKLTDAHLQTHGVSVNSIQSMMRWQAGCMRALADNLPPPMPPADLDLQAMMAQAQNTNTNNAEASSSNNQPPSITAMQAAEAITANPFDPSNLESDTVKEEHKKLVLDHSNAIEFGGKYDDFDPLGKLAYLDEIEKIEDRWEAFFFRFKLMDAIDKDYKKQCDQFLASMSMNEDDYRKLLKNCHQLMRDDAERERNLQNI